MDEKQLLKGYKKECSRIGYALLIYYGILNVCVMLVSVLQTVVFMLKNGVLEVDDTMMQTLTEQLMGNAWGYIIACGLGTLFAFVWKKKAFCCKTVWLCKHQMKFGTFMALLCLTVACQAVFQILAFFAELILNQFGLSVMDSIESASMISNTFSMVLYAGIVAPFFEEFAFRGVIMRSFCRHGKRFAIMASAFLFGMFHGNLVQTPYAFCVGLILGYVAVEYSIIWAILLHLFNNLVLGYLFDILLGFCRPIVQELVYYGLIWGSFVTSVVILLVSRKRIAAYCRENAYAPMRRKAFFTCAGVIIVSAVLILNMLLML